LKILLALLYEWCSLGNNVHALTGYRRQLRGGKSASGWLMLALWLGISAFASSPELHQWLHSDYQQANHRCVITQVQEQSFLSESVPVLAPLPLVAVIELTVSADFQFLATWDYRLSPSRAPPSGVFLQLA
jgi:hypothetical protein